MFLTLRGALVCDVAASAPPNTSAMMGSSPNVIRRMFSLYVIVLLLFNLSSCKRTSRATRLLPVWLHHATTDRMPESGIMVQPEFLAISPDCVFDASLVPGTCPGRFLDLKGLINKFLESRVTGQLVFGAIFHFSGNGVNQAVRTFQFARRVDWFDWVPH